MSEHGVVIVAAKRTPIGAFQGVFTPVTATQLGAAAIRGALEAAGIGAAEIQEVIMGCVLPAGLGQAPARQAAIGAGIPVGTPATRDVETSIAARVNLRFMSPASVRL